MLTRHLDGTSGKKVAECIQMRTDLYQPLPGNMLNHQELYTKKEISTRTLRYRQTDP